MTRSRQIADASVGRSRRRQTPVACIVARGPRTTNARYRRPAPTRQHSHAAAAAGGCACAAYDRATARFDHPLAQRFPAKRDAMILAQLLRRQSRAKIPVPLADDRQNRAPQCFGFAPIAAAIAPFRNQAGWTLDPIGLQQSKHLTSLEPQQLRCRLRR